MKKEAGGPLKSNQQEAFQPANPQREDLLKNNSQSSDSRTEIGQEGKELTPEVIAFILERREENPDLKFGRRHS